MPTGFNPWGYAGGCEFAYEACNSQQPESSFFCNRNSNIADEMCTSDRFSTGVCQTDSRETYDGCSKVKEYSNGGCANQYITLPPANAQINGWYKGPFSRCIQESAGFGRNGFQYTDRTKLNAQCYQMMCMDGQLWIVIEGQQLPCPSGGYVELDYYPGGLQPLFAIALITTFSLPLCVQHGVLFTRHQIKREVLQTYPLLRAPCLDLVRPQKTSVGLEKVTTALCFVTRIAAAMVHVCVVHAFAMSAGLELHVQHPSAGTTATAMGIWYSLPPQPCYVSSAVQHESHVGPCAHGLCLALRAISLVQVCHHSGQCVSPADSAAWDAPATGAINGTPAQPAAGYFEYASWGTCSQTCDGSKGIQQRTVVCHGDCSQLTAAEVQRACEAKPCLNACDSNPCGEDNLCSAQEVDDSVSVTCLCTDGSAGEYCHLSSTACHMDTSNECCPVNQALSITGECCPTNMSLDTSGLCCPTINLDGCGVCRGDGVLVDSLGSCCPVATTDANGACCLGSQVDACGMFSCIEQLLGADWNYLVSKYQAFMDLNSPPTTTVNLSCRSVFRTRHIVSCSLSTHL